MEVKDLASLKRTRAIRKGKLTMSLNELNDELKEEDMVPEQIRQLIEKCKSRLEAVETSHDNLLEAITDEEEFEAEEQWLEQVVRSFNKLIRAGRKAISSPANYMSAVSVSNSVNESDTSVSISNGENRSDTSVSISNGENQSDTSVSISNSVSESDTSVSISNGVNQSDKSVSISNNVNKSEDTKGKDDVNNSKELKINMVANPVNTPNVADSLSTININNGNSGLSVVQAMALPKAQVKKFDGDPLSYYSFIASFNNSVSCISDCSIKLNVLRSLCSGRALDVTEYCVLKPPDEGLKSALSTLKQRFGNSAVIVQAWIQKIVSRPRVEPAKLENFADDLTNCYEALGALGYVHELNNQASLKNIIDKLPKFLQQRWTREVYKLKQKGAMPGLKDVVEFVRASSAEVNDPVYGTAIDSYRQTKSSERTSGRVFQTQTKVVSTGNKKMEKWKKCWGCQTDDHWPDQCETLLGLSPTERLNQAKENHVCFSCFKKAGKSHSMANCRRKRKCTDCEQFHHPLLHQTTQTQQLMTLGNEPDVVMPMLIAYVSGKKTNVLFDTCATLTLIRDDFAKECNFPSKPITVEITTLGSEMSTLQTRAYNVTLTSKDGSSHTLTAIGVPSITHVREISTKLRADVERRLGETIHRGSGDVDILVGINYAKMHTGQCIEMGNYVVRKSPLGWVVFGTNASTKSQQQNPVLLVNLAEPVDLTKFWSTEEMGVRCDCSCKKTDPTLSPNDKATFDEMWDSCEKGSDGHWIVPYPWKRDSGELPDNKKQVMAKLTSIEGRLQKDSKNAKLYDEQMQQMEANGFSRRLTREEITSYNGPVHYISHHPVIKPEKKSTPVRIVFNSSASFNGHRLNDYWHKGPDLLNDLFGVLLRFRQYPVAVSADIAKMYHQVRIPEADKHVHRFLWRNYERREPDVYVKEVVTFGDMPAPAMALIALRKTADEGADKYPEAARVIKCDTYMDDICSSTKSVMEAKHLTHAIDDVLDKGGFHVKGWTSNANLREQQGKEKMMIAEDSEKQKVLGVTWDPETDYLQYNVTSTPPTDVLTKRVVLSELAKIFDPIGFTGALLIRGKIIMQRLWQRGVEWDEELTSEDKAAWKRFFTEVQKLDGVSFPRCLIPNDFHSTELVLFCDASEEAFGVVAYVRNEAPDATVEVRFAAAKSRVAPLKYTSIPRLELQGAVLAARLYTTLKKEMSAEISRVTFLSDSAITLTWIRGQSRLYKPFVANRVSEIQSATDPSDWRHIPGEHNIADKISRGVDIEDLQGDWKDGPPFLRLPHDEWPRSIPKANQQEIDIEKKRIHNVMLIQDQDEAIDVDKFSNWRKLVRVTAYVFRFITNAKAKCCVDDGPLSSNELSVAEQHWIIKAQKSLKDLSSYKSLSPFKVDGIVHIGGRTSNEVLSYDTSYPVLLPRDHQISKLITRYVHETGHYGIATTAAKVRQRYWILQGTRLAKTVKFRCTTCRAFEHKTETQIMADLPLERVTPFSPPFYFTSCDYFGPYHVKISRNKTAKHYGVIFTCLVTRAVHLELAVDCSTQEFIQVLRRFYSIRGRPKLLQSDNGTQFVGAERELRNMITGWDKNKLKEYCAENQMTWRFTTPLAPHHNGCAESLVKSCKRALKKSIGNQMLTPFELYTYLQEVANLINERPIGRKLNDPDDGAYICPNDILLGRSTSHVPQGPFRETRNPQRRVEYVQKLVDAFWKAWIRDVLPTLVPRRKWNVERRDVQVGDIVALADPNSTRGKWTIARVTEVFPGKDGHVRNVKLKAPNGTYSRPITKLAVIYPAEGYE